MSLTSSSDQNSTPAADTHQPVVLLPDASFLLHGEFERVGFDLVITNPAGEKFVIADYFAMQSPPTLMIEGGAGLTPEMVASLMPNQFEGVMYAGPATSGAVLEEIGTVRFARGDVEITDRNGDVRTVGRGDPVFEGDRIETGDRSFIRISMDDGTRFNLGKNAEATLDNFEYDQDAGTGNFEAMVRVGGFEYKSGDIGEMNPDSRHSTIKTPSAFIGIRGSELEGVVDESGQTIIVHRSGILEITDINGENLVELTEPGETSVIVMDGAPTYSSQLTPEQIQVLEEYLPPPDTGEDEVQEEGEEGDQETETGDDTVLSQQPSEATLSDATPIDSGEADVSAGTGIGDGGITDPPETGDGETTTVHEEIPEEETTDPFVPVTDVNVSPVAVDDVASTDENTVVVTGDVLANDSDADGDNLSTIAFNTTETVGLVSPNENGTFSYDPNGQFESLGQGETATDSFTYIVSDGNGGTDTANVTVTIDGVNDAPVVGADTFSAFVGRTTVLNVLANDTDIDGDTLSVSTGALSELSGGLVANTITYTTNPLFGELELGETETIPDTFSYTVSDPSGETSTASVTVNIGPDESVPNGVDDDFSTLPFTNFVTGNVLANDFGGSGSLTVQDFDTRTTFGSPVVYNGDGTFTVFPTSRLTPGGSEVPELLEEPFQESFEYTVVDEAGETSTAEISVTVSGFDQITRTEITEVTTFNGDLADTSDLFLNDSAVDVSGTGNSIAGFLVNLNSFQVAGGSDLAVGTGIDNQGFEMTIDGSLTLGGGLFRNSGTLEGIGTVDVSSAGFLGSGRIAPSGVSNIGTFTIVGDAADPNTVKLTVNSTLDIDFNDNGFDELSVDGAAHLGGDVSASGFFEVAPPPGETFDIITTTDGYTGAIRSFDLPIVSSSGLPLVLNPIQDGTNVSLEVLQPTAVSDGLGTITPGPGQGEVVLGTSDADIFDLSVDASGDSFYGDQGADTFTISDLSFNRIDGGGSLSSFDGDTLEFTTADFDLRAVAPAQIDSVDTINMKDGQAGTLQLTVDSALNINDMLTVPADPGDHIVLDAAKAGFVFESFDLNLAGQGDMFLIGGLSEQGNFASVLVSPDATAQINESGGDVWHFGSTGADQMNGSAADEFFFGRDGDDQILAGAGEDTVFYAADDVTGVDGGDGFDTLVPDASRVSLPVDLTVNNPYTNFEFIDLRGEFRDSGESNTLTLDMADVAQMGSPNLLYGDGTTQLIIEGRIDDYVILNGQNLREGDPAGLVKETDPRFPEFVSYSDGANRVLVEAELLGPGVNHAPVADPDRFTTRGDQAIDIDVLANDRDPDPGDTLTLTMPAETSQNIPLVDNGDGTFRYDPGFIEGSLSFDTFEYTLTDSNGVTTTGVADIFIDQNSQPEVSSDLQVIAVEDPAAGTFTVDLLGNAFDADGDALNIQNINPNPSGGIQLSGTSLIIDPSHVDFQDVDSLFSFSYEIFDDFGGQFFTGAQVRIAGPTNEFTNASGDNVYSNAANWSLNEVPDTAQNEAVALIPDGFSVTSSNFNNADILHLNGALSLTSVTFDANGLIMGAGANLDIVTGSTFRVEGSARLDSTASITGAGTLEFAQGTSTDAPDLSLPGGYTVADTPWQILADMDIRGGSLAIDATGVFEVRGGSVVVNATDFSNDGNLSLLAQSSSPSLHLSQGLHNTQSLNLDNFSSTTGTATIEVFGGELLNQGTISSRNTGGGEGLREIRGEVINEDQINVDYDLTINTFDAEFFNSPGATIAVDGGQTLTFSGGGLVFNEGTIDGTLGTGNTLDVTDVTFNNEGGTIEGFGTINGTVTGGTVVPGNSPGLLEINGDYINSEESALEIELEGTEPGVGYDQVVVSGRAELDGRLNVSMLNGFMPAVAAGFVVLIADTVEGSFDEVSGLDIADDRVLDLNYVDDQVELVSLAVTESGTDGNDVLGATPEQDVFVAGIGDDVIGDIGSDDIVYGQEGNDTFQVHGEFKRIDGGDGIDMVQLSDTVDLGNMDPVAVDNVEVLSLQNGREDTLELDAQTIKGMVDGHNDLANMDNALVLLGEPGDLVQLEGDFVADGEQTVAINGEEVALRVFAEDDVAVLVSDSTALEIHRSDGSVETVDALNEELNEEGNDILSDSIDMSGLDVLVSTNATSGNDKLSHTLAENIDLTDMIDDGSNSLDALLGGDDASSSDTPLPVIDPYANYVPRLSDPMGSTSLADYSTVEV